MEIEVLTTKRKLTKSIVRQLETANTFDMEYFVNNVRNGFRPDGCMGYYLRGMGKGYSHAVAIFQGRGKWVTINLRNWGAVSDLGVECPERLHRNFSSTEVRDQWLAAYDSMKKLCLKNHLII